MNWLKIILSVWLVEWFVGQGLNDSLFIVHNFLFYFE